MIHGATATGDFTGLAGWVVDVIDSLGLVGLAAITLLENLFPPIPSELVLPLAGYLSGRGEMSFGLALVASTVGSTVGAFVLYWLGRLWGEERVDRLVAHIPLVNADDIDKGERWFHDHGRTSVLVGRLIPGVRSVVSLPAGFQSMPFGPFLALTVVGTVGWNLLLISLGYALGSQWEKVSGYADWVNYAIYVAIAVLVVRFVWHRRDRIGGSRAS